MHFATGRYRAQKIVVLELQLKLYLMFPMKSFWQLSVRCEQRVIGVKW